MIFQSVLRITIMKNFLYISLIAVVLSASFASSLASADNSVLFMKANSSAKINIEYTFSRIGNWTMYPSIYPVQNSGGPSSSIIVMANPSFLNMTFYQLKNNITYTITPKNNTIGTFEMYTGFCGHYYPIVVGLNKSEVNPKIFDDFNTGDNFGCSPYEPNIRTENVIGYSDIIPITLSENSSMENTQVQSLAIPEFPFVIPILLASMMSILIFYRMKLSFRI